MDSLVLRKVELTFQLLSFLPAQIRVGVFHKNLQEFNTLRLLSYLSLAEAVHEAQKLWWGQREKNEEQTKQQRNCICFVFLAN